MGPRSVTVDRFDYSNTIADSWKQQTLLNIVKLRYLDLPVFVDVSSIVAGYSMETGGNLGGDFTSSAGDWTNKLTLGAEGKFTDRPTITYVPLTGEKFLLGLLTPIDPKNIFFMLQSGYPADFILGLSVESLCGLHNRSVVAGAMREADPEFLRVLGLLREVQAVGAVGMRVEEDKVKGKTAVIFLRKDNVSPEIQEKQSEIRRLLNLTEGREKFLLTYSPGRGGEGELAVNSRSILQVMGAFSSYLDVPEAHVKDRSVPPGLENTPSDHGQNKIQIRSGREKPENAYTAVNYRGHWFWIDESNWQTKRALSAIVFFFTLAGTGGAENLPMITIPAQ
jgi:hypothetical protein